MLIETKLLTAASYSKSREEGLNISSAARLIQSNSASEI
jgi:hypothetical protein